MLYSDSFPTITAELTHLASNFESFHPCLLNHFWKVKLLNTWWNKIQITDTQRNNNQTKNKEKKSCVVKAWQFVWKIIPNVYLYKVRSIIQYYKTNDLQKGIKVPTRIIFSRVNLPPKKYLYHQIILRF